MHRTTLIAEIGQAHDGSLGILHSYIDALSATGVDVIKFQTHIAEAESSAHEKFRIPFSYVDKTRYDYWKRMSFTLAQWQGIKDHCDKVGVEFMSSPFSNAAVDLLEQIDVNRYKIGSGEIGNHLLLERIGRTQKPVILSSGMSAYDELDNAIDYLKAFGCDVSVMQCTTAYPTPYEQLGLNIIGQMKSRYPDKKIGLSEHTGEIFAGLAAVANGAELLEFHAVFDKSMFGPDTSSSLTIDQIKELVRGVRLIERSLNNHIDKDKIETFMEMKKNFGKSLAINKGLKVGDTITLEDLESKKPAGYGIDAAQFKSVLGKKLVRDMEQWSFLNETDIV